tara:strand:- start:1874 stop:3394 length:1521 start_codon:yes stop_codon:yes gene_type:complete
MDKIQKINAVQGSFDAGTNATKIFADFQINSGAVLNMKDSYINVCMKITHTDTYEGGGGTDSAGRGLQMLDLGLTDTTLTDSDLDYPNVALVKNAFMSGSKVGKIDEVRRCDALKSALYNFEKDLNDKEDKSYYSLRGTKQEEEFRNSPFQHLERVGTNVSVNKVHNVKVRMSEIFDLCNETQLDTNLTGNLDMHLELNLDKLVVKQALGATDGFWALTPPRQTDAHDSFEDQLGATGGQTGSTLVVKNKFSPKQFKRFSPFHNGQRLSFSATGGTGGGGATTNFERLIVKIEYDNTAETLTLTLDSDIKTLANGDTLTGITCVGVDINTSAIEVEKIEMVLHEVANPSNVPTSYSYFTYPLEEDNIPTLTQRKNYMIEGDTQNVYITFGDIQSTFSTGNPLTKYRFTVNNEDLTNRDLTYGSAESNDLFVKTYKNNQRQLKNLMSVYIDADETNDGANQYQLAYTLMTPVVQRDDSQQSILGVSMDRTTDPIGQIKIYQERVKTI